jgi:hypothetical protein
MSVESGERPGRHSTSRNDESVAQLRDLLRNDRLAILKMAEKMEIPNGSRHATFTECLGMGCVSHRFVRTKAACLYLLT